MKRHHALFGRFSLLALGLLAMFVALPSTSRPLLAAPPRQMPQEIDITVVAQRIGDWHRTAFRGYHFNQWIWLGDVTRFNERIADGDLQAFIDPAFLTSIDANAAYVDCDGIGCSNYLNDMVLADTPDKVPAQTLWHEGMHAILDEHDLSLEVADDEIYTWYVENVVNHALPWLEQYEKELGKGEACDQKLLDQKWATFVEKMQEARNTGYGVISTDAQIEQLHQLTGFRVNVDTIRQGYVDAGLTQCAAVTPTPEPSSGTLADLDLIFCVDVTGSMADDIDSVKTAAASIVDTAAASHKSYRVAIVAYRDWNDSSGYAMFEDYAFSSDKAAIIANINRLSVGGGDDTPEAVFEALMRAIDSKSVGSWRNNVNKQIILMGDAPPHNPSSEGLTPAIVAKAAEDADPVVIQAVVVGNDGVYDSDAVASFRELAELTKGNLFEAADASQVPQVLKQTIEDIQPPSQFNLPFNPSWGIWLVVGGGCLALFVIFAIVVLTLVLGSRKRRRTPAPYPQQPPGPYPPPQPAPYPQQSPGPYPPPQPVPYPQGQAPPPGGWSGETVIGAPPAGMAELIVESESHPGARFPLGPNVRLGRAPDNDIVLGDAQVSRYHATIVVAGPQYVISDLGSANGTIVNAVRIQQPTPLRDGDLITIGNERLRFRQG
ncbi:MAG: FHA domain-containing protein [Anaerolineae bacterium]|nr:FHA domain-containing protein [Anaerolineae bacterium]